jgi:hypothetical protein
LTPPSAQAAVLSVPSASVVVQSLEDLINAFFAGVMEVARIVDVVLELNLLSLGHYLGSRH